MHMGVWPPLLLIVLPFFALIGLLSYQSSLRVPALARDENMVVRTSQVIETALTLKTALQDSERGERGYLLTGESSYLEPYHAGVRDAPQLLLRLGDLTAGHPDTQRWIAALSEAINLKRLDMQGALDAYARAGLGAAQDFLRTNAGQDAMRSADTMINALISTEQGLLAQRLSQASTDERATTRLALGSSALATFRRKNDVVEFASPTRGHDSRRGRATASVCRDGEKISARQEARARARG